MLLRDILREEGFASKEIRIKIGNKNITINSKPITLSDLDLEFEGVIDADIWLVDRFPLSKTVCTLFSFEAIFDEEVTITPEGVMNKVKELTNGFSLLKLGKFRYVILINK